MNNKKLIKPLILVLIALVLIVIGVVLYMKPTSNSTEEVEEVMEVFNITKEVRVSTKKLTLKKGESKTFNITVTGAVGIIEVTPNNSLITVSSSNTDCNGVKCFYDAYSEQVIIEYTVTGVNSGSSEINIQLTDLLTPDEKEITGSGTIEVAVE